MSQSAARFTLSDLLAATGGVLLGQRTMAEEETVSVSTDTRTIQAGQFFLPLSGERFDGHTYLEQALGQGAAGAFVSQAKVQESPAWQSLANIIVVPEPVEAYLALGRFHRRRCSAKVVAVTGSSGKTTTKELLFAGLSACYKTQCTEKNFNNEVGVSQTLLSLQSGTEVLVCEMGMRGLHQIELLSKYAEPDVSVVVNVGPAHIGLLGSLENIARAKCEIFSGMPPQAVGVVNGDDALLLATAQQAWTGSLSAYRLAEVEAIEPTAEGGIAFTYQGHRVTLSIPGRHNVSNALAVLKVAEALGAPIETVIAGLATYAPQAGRWHKTPLVGYTNAWVINDAYNANPSSMRAALQAFLESPENGLKRILVLGAMNELGEFSQSYHEELGRWLAAQTGIEALYLVGEEAQWVQATCTGGRFPVYQAATAQEAATQLAGSGQSLENHLLFLKGSRSFQLEAIPEALSTVSSMSGGAR